MADKPTHDLLMEAADMIERAVSGHGGLPARLRAEAKKLAPEREGGTAVEKDPLVILADEVRAAVEKINVNASFLTQAGYETEIDTQAFFISDTVTGRRTGSFNQFTAKITKTESL